MSEDDKWLLTVNAGSNEISVFNVLKQQLVLTDIVMPGIGGRQLALEMRDSHPETRVLYVSGYSDTSLPRPALGNSNEYLIEKPFKPEALAVKVREVLDAA